MSILNTFPWGACFLLRVNIFLYLAEEEALALAVDGDEVVMEGDGVFSLRHKRHPLYSCVALTLLAEIINAR